MVLDHSRVAMVLSLPWAASAGQLFDFPRNARHLHRPGASNYYSLQQLSCNYVLFAAACEPTSRIYTSRGPELRIEEEGCMRRVHLDDGSHLFPEDADGGKLDDQ